MAKFKTVTVIISDDGSVEFNQEGYSGKECQGDIADLINAIGEEKKVTKKPEFYKDNKVQVRQRF